MNLKIVYGPPPADEERIESLSMEQDGEIHETDSSQSIPPDSVWKKGKGEAPGCLTGLEALPDDMAVHSEQLKAIAEAAL